MRIKELIELVVCPPKAQFPESGERVNVNTIIKQQHRIEQLEVELSKYRKIEGYSIHGK